MNERVDVDITFVWKICKNNGRDGYVTKFDPGASERF